MRQLTKLFIISKLIYNSRGFALIGQEKNSQFNRFLSLTFGSTAKKLVNIKGHFDVSHIDLTL